MASIKIVVFVLHRFFLHVYEAGMHEIRSSENSRYPYLTESARLALKIKNTKIWCQADSKRRIYLK